MSKRAAERPGERWDAVVVGSGIGGLAAASLLAQVAGMRVLVLERHFRAGGLTHTFRRGRWKWDVGLHYVGEMGAGCEARAFMDLVTGGAVRWHPMPERFDRFVYPDLEVEASSDPTAYREELGARFPAERPALERYFADLRRASGWVTRRLAGSLLPGPLGRLLDVPGRGLALQTTGDYLARRFADPRLRAVLASQWGDYGLPPSRSAFAMHALVASHYLHGAWYPVGGADTIAAGARARIEAAGGAVRVGQEVEEILVDDGRAAGVRVRTRDGLVEHRAALVISGAGADRTFACLLPAPLRDPAPPPAEGTSAVTLFLGLSRSPAELGLRGENLWLFSSQDHEAIFDDRNGLLEGRVGAAFLSLPSLKDPAAQAHTAEITTHADLEPFRAWRDRPWRRRGEAYEALKARIGAALLATAERRVPGLSALVEHAELSTPLTLEHFGGQRRGLYYGIPATPGRMASPRCRVRTRIPGLLLAGADAGALGIVGAMMGGVLAAAATLGPAGFPRLRAAARRGPAPLGSSGPAAGGEFPAAAPVNRA